MHRILFLPDIRMAGFPANPKVGYRISGKGRIPDIRRRVIRPDTWLDNYNYKNSFTIYRLLLTLNKA
jgi:hypothetical protein